MIVVAVNDSPGNDDVVEQAMVEAQLRHAPVLALGVWRDDLGEMPHDELDRRVQFWIQRYPSVQIHAAAPEPASPISLMLWAIDGYSSL